MTYFDLVWLLHCPGHGPVQQQNGGPIANGGAAGGVAMGRGSWAKQGPAIQNVIAV